MKSILFLIVVLSMVIISCKNPTTTCSERISCDSLLRLIVLSTDLDSSLKNKEIVEDGTADGYVQVKIYHRNEVEPDAFFQAADCFVLLDLANLKAYRGAVEIDSNIEIHADTSLIRCYKKKCQGL